MNQLKFVIIVVLLPLIGHAQSKAMSGNDTIQNTVEQKLKTFSEASDFFFSTLSENFEGDDKGEDMYTFLRIFSKSLEDPEDFFNLHVDAKKFKTLNASLEAIYDGFFPVHIYIYEKDSIYRNHVFSNRISNKTRDTLVVKIPTNMPCYTPRNTFVEGLFKGSFAEQLLADKTDSKVKSELQPLLDFSRSYSTLNFSFGFSARYDDEQLNEIYNLEYNRILTSLVFWEYLTDCANYDLNTRKYFYED